VKACAHKTAGSTNDHPGTTSRGPDGGDPSQTAVPRNTNAAALRFAQTELKHGVHETGGANSGPKVSQYLKNAGIGGPAPWCAAFVKWCLNKAGFTFPSGAWASCQTYINEAAKPHGVMFKVSHADAHPGDLIVFGGEHIAMVESSHNGVITYVGGNQSDAITRKSISSAGGSYTIVRPRAQH
jgi:hypothetical protein